MRKRRIVLVVAALLCLVLVAQAPAGSQGEKQPAAAGAAGTPTKVGEAPMLVKLVAEGKLPSVDKRLPSEPKIVKPVEQIGQYGGTWRSRYNGKPGMLQTYRFMEHPVEWSSDYKELLPNVVKSYEGDAEGKVYTFQLRKGMRWSDGQPFTANDFVFWYDDLILNDELNPVKPAFMKIGGELGILVKVDDYTVKVTFAKPYGMFMEQLQTSDLYAPAHYLKQFLPKYGDKAALDKLMKEGSFQRWMDLFSSKATIGDNPDLPVLQGWVALDRFTTPVQRYQRNPYYWKVDTAGNQLPYIDYLEFSEIPVETIVLKAMAGEIDLQNRHLSSIANYQLFVENEKKGDYRMVFGVAPGLNLGTIYLNFFHPNKAVANTFRDIRFRQALSQAINREEVNKMLYKGLAIPSQQAPSKGDPWYEERFGKAFTEYDVAKANALLDEMGLKWDAKHEWRVFPDGKSPEFAWIILGGETGQDPLVEMSEMCKRYFKVIGINILPKPTNVQLWGTKVSSADFDIGFYLGNAGAAGYAPIKSAFVFPFTNYTYWGSQWGLWYSTGGKSGEAPPPEVKQIMDIYDKINAEPSLAKRTELYKQAFDLHSKNLWLIGLLNRPVQDHYYIVKNNMRNVPNTMQMEQASMERMASDAAQFYFKQ
jgi:peptide/nickel transport system substrate-binding protein